MSRLLAHVARVVAVVMLAAYLLLLVHIPLLAGEPNWVLGTWLGIGVAVLGVGCWLVYAFSWRKFAVWSVLVIAMHGMVWWVPAVRGPFAHDSCLDRGGKWYADGTCEGARMPSPSTTP